MTEQEVFNMLSDLEEYFYYKRDQLNPTLDEIHDRIKKSLEDWHEYTGCKNED